MDSRILTDKPMTLSSEARISEKADFFDYEAKTWGAHDVRVSPTYLGALRLRYCLDDLSSTQGKVLEVGCGGGGMIRGIGAYRPDLELYACDFSESAIRSAITLNRGHQVRYGIADGYKLPYQSNFFDSYVMFDVLEHVEDPSRVAREIFRVLKPGGLFSIFIPCEGEIHTLHGLLAMTGWRAKELYGGHIQQFTSEKLKELLNSAGFPDTNMRWSCHIVNQIADVLYFSTLSLAGRNSSVSVEGYLTGNGEKPLGILLAISKNLIAAASYFESRFLSRVPGAGAHFAGHKPEIDSEQHLDSTKNHD